MSTAAKTPSRRATEAELLALPDDGHGWEVIDGELVEKEAGFRHGQAQVQVAGELRRFHRRRGSGDTPGGWWILTEQLVRFSQHTLRPDVSGWLREHMPEPADNDDSIIRVRPDWVCEIISPGKAAEDPVRKKRIYHQHQVPHYWIIDPRDETLTVHRWSQAGYTEVLIAQRGEHVRAEPFQAIELPVGVLFGDDQDDEPQAAR